MQIVESAIDSRSSSLSPLLYDAVHAGLLVDNESTTEAVVLVPLNF